MLRSTWTALRNLRSPEFGGLGRIAAIARPAGTGSWPLSNNSVLASAELPESSTDHRGRSLS
jgi:hypothetical protein